MTLADLILALCDFADSHPEIVDLEVACRSGGEVVQLVARDGIGETVTYVIGVGP